MPAALSVLMAALACGQPQPGTPVARQDLSVAVFLYTPDAYAAAEALETEFEKKHRGIDLDIDLVDPYKIGLVHGEVFNTDEAERDLAPYDIVEIDLCKLDDLRPLLDRLPAAFQKMGTPHATLLEGAMAKKSTAEYLVPHWTCGNLVVTWTDSKLEDLDSFKEIASRMNGAEGSCVLADFYGGTTLGEYYADWLIDRHGAAKARDILRALGAKTPPKPTPEELMDESWEANPLTITDIDPDAVKDFRAVVMELHPALVKQLSRYHYASDAYPRRFFTKGERGSVLIGYSERLYFVGAERSLDPTYDAEKDGPQVKAEDVDVRPLAFADKSAGTPVWIDGFVVPNGKLQAKEDAIAKFLDFVTSADGYRIFRQPPGYGPAAHLLPASAAEYSGNAVKDCPALTEFRDALRDPVVLDESDVWRGINYTGAILKNEVKAAAKARVVP